MWVLAGFESGQFCTDPPQQFTPDSPLVDSLGGIMAIPKNEKRKQYAHYAAHCMYLVTAATDPDACAIQREMAAEWLKLADDVRRRSKLAQMQMG
jgi:hypothetical protein